MLTHTFEIMPFIFPINILRIFYVSMCKFSYCTSAVQEIVGKRGIVSMLCTSRHYLLFWT